MGATREELVVRARALLPDLADRALACEQLRQIPDATFQAFKDAGLLRVFVPKEFGGDALELGTVIDIARETGKACGSSSWCLAISNLHNRMAAGFPRAAQEEVFGPGPDSVVCGVFMPGGQAIVEEGGYRLTGQWDFASACDHAGHAILAALVQPAADAPPTGMGAFLVRRQDFAIDDNWFVAGLAGTGSKRIAVDEVFVPQDWALMLAGGAESADGQSGEALAAGAKPLPTNSVATLGLVGVTLGVAAGALEHFQTRLGEKVRMATFRAPQEQVAAQLRLAESAAEVDSAELLVLRDCEEMERCAAAGLEASPEQRGRYRRDAAHAIQVCARAVARLVPAAGAHAIFSDDPIQRAMRDTQVMSAHAVANWDQAGESYSRALLGLPVEDPIF